MSESLLHLPTMLVMTVVGSLVMAAGLLLVAARRRREGLGLWAAALLMQSLAYVLLALRGRIPDILSIVVANALLAGVFASLLAAVYQFLRRPVPWLHTVPPVLLTIVLFVAFLGDYTARLVLAGLIYPAQAGLVLWTLGRHPSEGYGARMVAAGIWLQAAVLVVRALAAITGHMPASGLLAANFWQHATFLATFVTVQASSFGFIFMARDRADAANERMAARDPLTDVPNRRATIAALDRCVAQAVRSGEPLSVMMLDIDHFKRINDGLGHLAGTRCCAASSMCWASGCDRRTSSAAMAARSSWCCCRALRWQARWCWRASLRAAVEQAHFEFVGRTVPVTLSIGVAGGVLEPGDRWDGLVAAADEAMYRAKRAGRNQVAAAGAPRPAAAGPGADSATAQPR